MLYYFAFKLQVVYFFAVKAFTKITVNSFINLTIPLQGLGARLGIVFSISASTACAAHTRDLAPGDFVEAFNCGAFLGEHAVYRFDYFGGFAFIELRT